MAAKKSAIEAGYSKKNADPSGYQALKTIKGRAALSDGTNGVYCIVEPTLYPLPYVAVLCRALPLARPQVSCDCVIASINHRLAGE
jgi:hypothetical protein